MLPDDEIISLFFARSETAISELDRKYGRLCRNIAYRLLESRQDAEECVNDAYLGVWNAVPPERPEPLRAYVAKIVRNLAVKAYWKRSAAKRGGFDMALEELDESLPSPVCVEAGLEAKELAAAIARYLDSLPETGRAVFMRRYYFGESYAEIAEFTGLSEKNVSVKLSRIRAGLRRYLEESGVML